LSDVEFKYPPTVKKRLDRRMGDAQKLLTRFGGSKWYGRSSSKSGELEGKVGTGFEENGWRWCEIRKLRQGGHYPERNKRRFAKKIRTHQPLGQEENRTGFKAKRPCSTGIFTE